jgi:hypothetical protein
VKTFAGKRILLIGIGFYDYEATIVERLRRHGATVQVFFDLPVILRRGALASALRRADVKALDIIKLHERRILRATRAVSYDFVLIIKSSGLRTEFLQALRHQQSRAEFILYLWDSLARILGIEERIPYFDRILTFDRRDSAARPDLQFRPLFYREDSRPVAVCSADQDRVDLCCVGWLHSDRLQMIRRIQSLAHLQGMSVFVYLYSGVFTSLKLALAGNSRDVHFRPLPYHRVMEMNRRASVIVDLPHAEQSGMTIRAIEAVGLGKKLMTTAGDVVNYDFFSEENVQLLRPDDLRLDRAFARNPAAPVSEEIRHRYSLDAWLEDVFFARASPEVGPT